MTRRSTIYNTFFSLCVLLSAYTGFSQDKQLVDSLKIRLTQTMNDSDRVNTLAKLGWEVSYNNLTEGLGYCEQARGLAERIGYKTGLSQSYNNMGAIYTDLGDYPRAIELHLKQVEIAKKVSDGQLIGKAYVNISRVYALLRNNKKSNEYERMALAVYLKDYDQTVVKYSHDPKMLEKKMIRVKNSIAVAYNNISESFEANNVMDSAMIYSLKSMRINEELHEEKYLALNYQAIAKINIKLKSYDEALRYLNKARECYKDVNEYDLASVCLLIGEVQFLQKKYIEAEKNYNEAIVFARKVGIKDAIKIAYEQLSALYEAKGDLKNALIFYRKYSAIKDSILHENIDVQLNLAQSRVDNEKKNTEIELLEQKNKAKESETTKQRTVIYSVIALLFIASLLAYILFVRNKEKIKTNKLLEHQKKEIESQKEIVDVQNKEITDSINYAQRIQQVILPQQEEVGNYFKDWFVFFQPKDVVSGDFYWVTQKEEKTYIAAIDCTGHGVPGAFMSMIGYTLLNEILNNSEIISPADVLKELRRGVIKSLKQKGVEGENKDGMDIALCLFSGNKLQYAGAYNPLWLIRNKEIIEYKADKQPIGIYGEKLNPFTNHTIDLQSGDSVYIFTDGYADQFGGPEGKKFKYSKLKELLLSVQQEPMNKQKDIISKQFRKWKGNLEQVDDVLLIGIKA
jgi:serine phosphatase RsbU (regulator of sigma subunit)